MAAKKSFKWLGGAERVVNPINSTSEFELNENDIWGTHYSTWDNTQTSSETKRVSNHMNPLKRTLSRKISTNHIDHVHQRPLVATSLPVNVPDWSKILGDEYRGTRMDKDEEGGGDSDERVPPHVYLARTRGASFSVQEGMGRTLKGRDLSRVRDAIWKITGFED